jgi:hypothetical protein
MCGKISLPVNGREGRFCAIDCILNLNYESAKRKFYKIIHTANISPVSWFFAEYFVAQFTRAQVPYFGQLAQPITL